MNKRADSTFHEISGFDSGQSHGENSFENWFYLYRVTWKENVEKEKERKRRCSRVNVMLVLCVTCNTTNGEIACAACYLLFVLFGVRKNMWFCLGSKGSWREQCHQTEDFSQFNITIFFLSIIQLLCLLIFSHIFLFQGKLQVSFVTGSPLHSFRFD